MFSDKYFKEVEKYEKFFKIIEQAKKDNNNSIATFNLNSQDRNQFKKQVYKGNKNNNINNNNE
tara:strand:+ start:234 stop:422 length:189 start_codon:yes stop_codon:yes gene_type:complete